MFRNQLAEVLQDHKGHALPPYDQELEKKMTTLSPIGKHVIHPLAGQGVNLGFKDAETLAEEILRAHSKGLDIGGELVLSRYQRRRQADNLSTMAAMEGFKQLFAADQPLLRLLRNEGMRLFDKLLPVKQHVMMKAMGLD